MKKNKTFAYIKLLGVTPEQLFRQFLSSTSVGRQSSTLETFVDLGNQLNGF
jgi:hypothetical protein